jgi:GTP-binding protein
MPATFLKSITDLAQLPPGKKPQIALVGRSNVGKSSLVNRLTNQKALARVSATPGHTQTINFYDIDGRYFLVDLPGYGFTRAAKSKRMAFTDLINEYLSDARSVALVLLVVDSRLGLTASDRTMLTALQTATLPTVVILNKTDKVTRTHLQKLTRELNTEFPELNILTHSTATNESRGELLDAIEQAVRKAS